MNVARTHVTIVNTGIALFLIFLGGLGILSGCNQYENKNREIAYKEKHKDGILYIDIFKRNNFITEIQTKASVYQKYKIKIIADKDILLDSSDIGLSVISEIKPNIWKCFDAIEYVLGDKKILVVFKGNATAAGRNIYDQISLICLDGKETFYLNLTGNFPKYGKFLEIINANTFVINNGEKELKFQTHNGSFRLMK